MLMKIRNKKGFTMVELMVVAAIVAILAAVLVPMMTGNKKTAYASEAVASLGTVRNALRICYAKDGAFPVLSDVVVENNVPGINTGDLLGAFFSGANYTITSNSNTYALTCAWNASANSAPRKGEISGYTNTTTLNQDGTFGGTY